MNLYNRNGDLLCCISNGVIYDRNGYKRGSVSGGSVYYSGGVTYARSGKVYDQNDIPVCVIEGYAIYQMDGRHVFSIDTTVQNRSGPIGSIDWHGIDLLAGKRHGATIYNQDGSKIASIDDISNP